MVTAILRFLVYRVAGGRVLLALTVLDWLRRRRNPGVGRPASRGAIEDGRR